MACIVTTVKCDLRVLFGTGDPGTTPGHEGWLYFDTSSGSSYAGWVYHNGAWHPFSSGTPVGTGTDTADYWFFMLMGTSNAR